MATRKWHYSENQFNNCSKSNFKRMDIISSDHDSNLNSYPDDPAIVDLFNYFHPYRLTYRSAYSFWTSSRALNEGATLLFENLIRELSGTKIEDWDIQIQTIYKRDTPQYKALLNNYRVPFQSGPYNTRINELFALINNIGTDASLAAVKTDIVAFTDEIVAARDMQQGKESNLKTASFELELERERCAKAMYYTLATLMLKYIDNPVQIEAFYDLEEIRKRGGAEDDVEPVDPTWYDIIMISDVTIAGTISIVLKGEAGQPGKILWGDGTQEDIVYDGTEQTYTHTYNDVSVYTITVRTGNHLLSITAQDCKLTSLAGFAPELTKIEEIMMPINQLTSFPDISTFVNIKVFNLYDNYLTEVDSYIIKINTHQTNDGQINVSGLGNELPEGTTAPIIQELISRGWIVTTTQWP